MTTPNPEPPSSPSPQEPRSLADLRVTRNLSLAGPSKPVPVPPAFVAQESRKTTPLPPLPEKRPAAASARPAEPRVPSTPSTPGRPVEPRAPSTPSTPSTPKPVEPRAPSPSGAAVAQAAASASAPAPSQEPKPASPSTITDEEYRKIRARLREDFIVLPKRLLRNWGATVGGTLTAMALAGFVVARQAGRGAAVDYLKSETGKFSKEDMEGLQLETREALERSREASEAAVDAHGQVANVLENLRNRLSALESFAMRLERLEKAIRNTPK